MVDSLTNIATEEIEDIFVLFIYRLIHKIVNNNHTNLWEGITRVKPSNYGCC